ncbi:hypothetical protein NP493_108g02022 [Ridgeia piscesae]|uniref:Uncharacterized protein n=1 Tax=Ridgeia piscesae TaxID=27915 RepID=A0AAD9P7F3_RIDPI|nr:hypothetical protein NP493_108g02022 [Ridgeia piscesae]
MAAFSDLGLLWSDDKILLQKQLRMAIKLGYGMVAINNYVEEFGTKGKKAKHKVASIRRPNEIKVDEDIVHGLHGTLEVKGRRLQQFSRVTTVFSEMGQTRDLQQDEVIQAYDILAVQPTTDKLFHTACTELEVDIISVDMTQRLPFFFRRQSIGIALERGVHFEIVYSPMIRDQTARCHVISNAQALINVCKGRNIIVSSACEKETELRGPYDVFNLALLFDLKEFQAKDAISINCRSVVMHGSGPQPCTKGQVAHSPARKARWPTALHESLGGLQPCTEGQVAHSPARKARWPTALHERLGGLQPCMKGQVAHSPVRKARWPTALHERLGGLQPCMEGQVAHSPALKARWPTALHESPGGPQPCTEGQVAQSPALKARWPTALHERPGGPQPCTEVRWPTALHERPGGPQPCTKG